MPSLSADRSATSRRAALYSACIPGLGQFIQQRYWQGLACFAITTFLVVVSVGLGRISGRAAEVFFFMLLTLPWWAFQSYDASLGLAGDQPDFLRTWRRVWSEGHDIRFLGALFFLSAINDTIIIVQNPEYLLPFYCTKPSGLAGFATKAISPVLHTAVGCGFFRLRRWSLMLYLLYASYGMTNALVNLTCFGSGRVRNTLLITLIGFTAYILWRRRCFLTTADLERRSRFDS